MHAATVRWGMLALRFALHSFHTLERVTVMAKRKRRTATRSAPVTKIVKAAAPIIRVSAPRAAPARRRTHRRRRSGSSLGGMTGGLISNESIQMAVGGALYGFAVKQGLIDKLPAIPVLGRTGTAAILLDYWSRHGGGQLAHRAARAAAAIAGYQLGHDGKISGDENFVTSGSFTMGDDATTPGSLAGDEDSY